MSEIIHALEKFRFVYGKTKQMYWHVEKVESVILPSMLNTAGWKTGILGFLKMSRLYNLCLSHIRKKLGKKRKTTL